MHSILFALLDRKRDEALFWTYELYFSGFETELVGWLKWIYYTFYALQNTSFTELFEIHLSRLDTATVPIQRDCLVGMIVSNLSHRAYDVRGFTLEYLKNPIPIDNILPNNHPILIRFLRRDLEKYQTIDICQGNPRTYLQRVSRFPIRKNESLFLSQFVKSSAEIEDKFTSDIYIDCYLQNWLFYVYESQIWVNILKKYPSFYVDNSTQIATFSSDDDIEEFYAKYGIEPDEQPNDVHLAHGIDISKSRNAFTAMLPDAFYQKYSTK